MTLPYLRRCCECAENCFDPTHSRVLACMQCLGRMDDFLEYYQSNRRLQLNSDLTPPPNFIESYQKFIAQVGSMNVFGSACSHVSICSESYDEQKSVQVVGFFIVEDRVQRAADMAVGLQLGAGWEAAVACLKATLESAFESMTSAESLIAVKDFVLLVCTALGVPQQLPFHQPVTACQGHHGDATLQPQGRAGITSCRCTRSCSAAA